MYAHHKNDFRENLEESFRRYPNQPEYSKHNFTHQNGHKLTRLLFIFAASVNYSAINHLVKDERHNINHFDAQG